MDPVVIPNSTGIAILTALIDTGALLDGAVLRLFQNNINPGPENVVGDFVSADFSGYAPSTTVVWGTPYLQSDGTANVAGDLKLFVADDPLIVTNTIYGWFLTNAGGTVLLASYRFSDPVAISLPLQALPVVPSYPKIAV